jgi:hypothetical protein
VVATTLVNWRLDEVYKRRSEILPALATSGLESIAASVAFLESISRPGGLGGPNPHDPIAVRAYEAEVSLVLLETLAAQEERISELEASVRKLEKSKRS